MRSVPVNIDLTSHGSSGKIEKFHQLKCPILLI